MTEVQEIRQFQANVLLLFRDLQALTKEVVAASRSFRALSNTPKLEQSRLEVEN